MRVTDFVTRINRSQIARQNHIRALIKNVGTLDRVPSANTGGHLVHITVADGNVSESLLGKLENDPEFIEKLSEKLCESGTVDQVLELLVSTSAEAGIVVTKEELKEQMKADSDEEALAGSIIVYANYLFVS